MGEHLLPIFFIILLESAASKAIEFLFRFISIRRVEGIAAGAFDSPDFAFFRHFLFESIHNQ
jgi:hypothetical protein